MLDQDASDVAAIDHADRDDAFPMASVGLAADLPAINQAGEGGLGFPAAGPGAAVRRAPLGQLGGVDAVKADALAGQLEGVAVDREGEADQEGGWRQGSTAT